MAPLREPTDQEIAAAALELAGAYGNVPGSHGDLWVDLRLPSLTFASARRRTDPWPDPAAWLTVMVPANMAADHPSMRTRVVAFAILIRGALTVRRMALDIGEPIGAAD
jgi:hypothetical protein